MAVTNMRTFKYFSIWQYLAILCLSWITSLANAAQLVASVDRDTIGIQETFTLTISADSNSKGSPDIATLKSDFEILSNNVSQFTSISNAGSEFKKVWQLTLAPKRIGTLLIPSFNVDGAVSDAIEIKVTKQTQNQATGDEDVRVSIEVDKNSIYVQEQLLVKIKLISRVNLSQAEMQPLDIKDAVVVPLSEKPKQYLTNINGAQHLILESNYAVFPQTSGHLKIPSLIYSVVPNVERDLWNDPFGRNRANILRLPTEEKDITVHPVPASVNGKPWQPANNVELHETWSASLDHLKMGEPVTRTITIAANGLTGGQIAPLVTPTIDGLTFYPDQPQNSDSKTDKGIEGIRTETMAIVPNRGGEFTLPEVRVEWWDSKTQSMQVATLPAKNLSVIGSSVTNSAPEPANNQANENTAAESKPDQKITYQTPAWFFAAVALFAIVSLVLFIYILKLRAKIKYMIADSEEITKQKSENEKHIWDLLKHAAANRNAAELRKALLGWAKFQWPDESIHSLDDIAKFGKKPELASALKKLDSMLYSNHPDETWDPNDLLRALNECRKEKNVKNKPEGLKPLYND
ncbi:BatD family protein [Cellvibrio sp.]|uniref:BatD family protein n=1 Tax=Cellvibrio sp. TaxID=1965322 RepID=UPI0039648AD8